MKFRASSNNHTRRLVRGYCVKEFGSFLDKAQMNQYRIGFRGLLQWMECPLFPVDRTSLSNF